MLERELLGNANGVIQKASVHDLSVLIAEWGRSVGNQERTNAALLSVLCCILQVKAVCSSGGHFVKLNGGGFEYQGGETRLIALPNYCSFMDLTEALERIAGTAAAFSSASSEQACSLQQCNILRGTYTCFYDYALASCSMLIRSSPT